ncbi:Phospholipid-transporting ATPase [Plasmodiophora brassicae]
MTSRLALAARRTAAVVDDTAGRTPQPHPRDGSDAAPGKAAAAAVAPEPDLEAAIRDASSGAGDQDRDKPRRVIRIGDEDTARSFCNNKVNTSKYTMVNFVPKCMFEQFSRVANCYFLAVSIIQVSTTLSPTSKFATLIPLLCVIFLSLVKEFLEDWNRHEADDMVNFSEVDVVEFGNREGPRLRTVFSSDVRVGDVLQISDGQSIPADSILLSTCIPNGIGFIETSNLDGETNLKIRQAVPHCAQIITNARDASRLRGVVTCDQPNANIHRFDGMMFLDGVSSPCPINANNIILRGAALRSTETAFVLVVYTGSDCKQARDARPMRTKSSNVERLVNRVIVFILLGVCALCAIATIGFAVWTSQNKLAWYVPFVSATTSSDVLSSLITFLILFNNLVPISLYLTLEVVKFVQAKLVECDIRLFHAHTRQRAYARTSALNEDLGQIEYIFSDKTGTLTRNQMVFKRVSIGSKVYDAIVPSNGYHGKRVHLDQPSSYQAQRVSQRRNEGEPKVLKGPMLVMHLKANQTHSTTIRDTLRVMSVCHSIFPERHNRDGNIILKYKSISADEDALVRGAFAYGYELEFRDSKYIGVCALGEHQRFRVLNINEFTPARACMSMVVMTPEGTIELYCKGSDRVIIESLGPDQTVSVTTTKKHLKHFAVAGLRTLTLSKAVLEPGFYKEWNKRFQTALSQGVSGPGMDKLASEIECNLQLLAVTAIEDCLQVGVPRTISLLSSAGIKMWILTGDKIETAITIGCSCNLITPDMTRLELSADSIPNLSDLLAMFSKVIWKGTPCALIVDGQALDVILQDECLCDIFFRTSTRCRAVLACRVTPRQKAAVVRLVKRATPSPLTLAIGDGANDVPMLQEADIGVAIAGNEGMQAVRASDFAIGQFKFLARLLLVHGTWSYRRISKVILLSFYKNIALVLTMFYYCAYNGYSGSSLYNAWLSGGWNVAFTLFPVVTFGVLDRDLEVTTILQYPKVYLRGQFHRLFNVRVFLQYVATALIHSLIVFLFGVYGSSVGTVDVYFRYAIEILLGQDWNMDMDLLGILINGSLVLAVNTKMAMETQYWTVAHLAAILGSITFWVSFIVIYSSMSLGDFYGMAAIMFSNPMSYAMLVLCATTIFILELGAQCVQSMLYPDPCTIVREVKLDSTFEVEKGASRTTGAEEEEDDVFFEEDHGLLPTNKNAIAATEEDNAMGQLLSSFAFSYPTLESATQIQEQKEYRDRHKKNKRKGKKKVDSDSSVNQSVEEPVFIINGPTVEALMYLARQIEEEESRARRSSLTRTSSKVNSGNMKSSDSKGSGDQ